MRCLAILLALALSSWPASVVTATEPIGPTMADALGQPCTLDSQTSDGFHTYCNADGLVFGVVVQLDHWSAWNRSHHSLCSRRGLQAFVRGAWSPPAPPRSDGGVIDRCVEEFDRGSRHWSVSACPHCRRPVLAVTVTDTSLEPVEDQVPDADHRQRWGDASVRAMTHYRNASEDELALFDHDDPLFRAAAITEFPSGEAVPAVVLSRLAEDADPTVARLAFQHGLQYYDPSRSTWMLRALQEGGYGDLLVALTALEEDERWLQHDDVRSALDGFPDSCREPGLASQATSIAE